MKKSKLDIPHIRSEVVRRLAVGQTQASIARDFGLHRSNVSRFAKRGDIRPYIEQEQLKRLDAVPDVVENVKGLVREMKDLPKGDTKRRELSYRASLDTLKAVGIMPSPIQSQVITTIFDQRTQLISPVIHELLKQIMGQSRDQMPEEEEPPSKD
jgi:predicted transcriptional regulator